MNDDLPPLNMASLVASSISAGGTYNTATNVLSWTIPVLSPGSSVTETYQMTMGIESAANGPGTVTNTAILNYTGGSVTANNSVIVRGTDIIHIAIYNPSGELIKTIATFQLNNTVSNFTLGTNVLQTDSETMSISYNGTVLGTWDGTNGSGNKVANGAYIVEIESTDPYGVTTTISKNVSVSIARNTLSIVVYNEAGEVVKNFNPQSVETLIGGSGGTFTTEDYDVGKAKLSPGIITPSLVNPNGNGNYLTITLGSGRSFTWNGTGDGGAILSSGQYYLEIKSQMANGPEEEIVMPFMVQGNGSGIPGVVLAPNPVNMNQISQARFLINTNGARVDSVDIKIYTMAGELADTLSSPGSPTQITWDLTQKRWSSSTYIAVVELNGNGGVLARQILKVAIYH